MIIVPDGKRGRGRKKRKQRDRRRLLNEFFLELCKEKDVNPLGKRPVHLVGGWAGYPIVSDAEAYKWLRYQFSIRYPDKVSAPIPPPKVRLPANEDFYSSREWQTVRYQALLKASGSCQCCGQKPSVGKPLHVDHIKPRSKYPHLALDVENLQVLCVDCNLGKGNWDETDWRPAPAQ